ncbi:hypothetical protein [Neptuniibacter sp. QD37_11]|uniref:hypothetical protein n=1 Tax=Neptuniibacter sp. QD37_11 TaxID=3398209 RepID=UPI0039F5F3B2
MLNEMIIIHGLRTKTLRSVRNPRRARKLRNRGEEIWWSGYTQGWLWRPDKPMGRVRHKGLVEA